MPRYIPIKAPQTPRAMKKMSRDKLNLLSAQGQEAGARTMLSEALCILGRFDEALQVDKDPARLEWIQSLIKAEALEEDARCECERVIDTADYTKNPNALPVLSPTPHYVRRFRYWSAKYGCMVWNYTCSVCGHSNSLPDTIAADDIKLRK